MKFESKWKAFCSWICSKKWRPLNNSHVVQGGWVKNVFEPSDHCWRWKQWCYLHVYVHHLMPPTEIFWRHLQIQWKYLHGCALNCFVVVCYWSIFPVIASGSGSSNSNFISNKYMKTNIYNTIALMITAMFTCILSVATRKSRGLSSWLPIIRVFRRQ